LLSPLIEWQRFGVDSVQIFREKGFGSAVCQFSRLCVVMETVVTREGVMAAWIPEDFCAGYAGKRAFIWACAHITVATLKNTSTKRKASRP